MVGRLVVLLLVANVAWFAWSQGWLRVLGLAPTVHAEPERLERQVRPESLTLRPLDAVGNLVDGFLPSPTTSQQLQPSVAYHRIVVESPDAFRVLATSGNDAQTHRLVHIVRYVRASVLAQDRLFANGFDPVP